MEYWKSLAETVVGWFAGGAVAVLSVQGVDLSNPDVWKGAALAGAAGVIKGLAAKYAGNRDSSTLTS